mgnify:CR=1 FL=1
MFNIIFFVVILTYIHYLYLNIRKINNDTKDLFWILSICTFTEIVSKILSYNNISLWYLYNFSFIIHNSFWLKILLKDDLSYQKKIIGSYIVFSVIMYGFIDPTNFFNKIIMIVGALLYLIIFIILSSKNLNSERIDFFKSNHFILISSPIIFFFGLSILFGFNSKKLFDTIVFGRTNLYNFIIIFVNIIYYSLLNIYIIKEKKDHA